MERVKYASKRRSLDLRLTSVVKKRLCLSSLMSMCSSGRDVFFEHVKSYELEFSTDGVSWERYKENGTSKVS